MNQLFDISTSIAQVVVTSLIDTPIIVPLLVGAILFFYFLD
jgi:hypothetical protein